MSERSLVLFARPRIHAESEVVRADDLGDGVAVVVDRVGVNPRHETWVNREPPP